jgi:hypothetical protein
MKDKRSFAIVVTHVRDGQPLLAMQWLETE